MMKTGEGLLEYLVRIGCQCVSGGVVESLQSFWASGFPETQLEIVRSCRSDEWLSKKNIYVVIDWKDVTTTSTTGFRYDKR